MDSASLTFAVATGPAHGTLSLGANGAYSYTPGNNYTGPDSFTFTASDGAATSLAATVSLTVNPVANQTVSGTTGLPSGPFGYSTCPSLSGFGIAMMWPG